jgi:uncharacterized protein (DUF2062 family)
VLGRICGDIRTAWRRLLETEREPHAVARGFAVGVFVGMLPLLGLQTMFALGLAFVVRGSKVAALLGTLVTNPVTFGPVLWADYVAGSYILCGAPSPHDEAAIGKTVETIDNSPPVTKAPAHKLKTLVGMGWRLLAPTLLGGAVLGAGLALVIYFPVAWLAARIIKKKQPLSLTRRMVMPVNRDDAAAAPTPAGEPPKPRPQPPPADDKPKR